MKQGLGSGVSQTELQRFYRWCIGRGTSEATCSQYVRYLQRPLDMDNKWSRLAWKLYYKYKGREDKWREIRVKRSGVDVYVPTDEEVRASLIRACGLSMDLCQVYKLLAYSGARLTEACRALEAARWQDTGGFYKQPLGWLRGAKRVFYIYSLEPLGPLRVDPRRVTKAAQNNQLLPPKYLRKWVGTKMISLGIPEEVVNYIQGRVPQQVLSKHYLKLTALADQYYREYAEWLREWIRDYVQLDWLWEKLDDELLCVRRGICKET